ncbi:MAG: trypsin-like peptidase domain-containing protein [bacterium]|nr:trypsin-like peptidase domain-containing protein [bacterium]
MNIFFHTNPQPQDNPQAPREKKFFDGAGILFLSLVFGFLGGVIAISVMSGEGSFTNLLASITESKQDQPAEPAQEQEQVVGVVERVSPAVVSIVATRDVQVVERFRSDMFSDPFFDFLFPQEQRIERREIGWGSGFFITSDGMVVTNRHVVQDEKAEYTIFTTDGGRYPVQVVARDPAQDLALLKVQQDLAIEEDGEVSNISFPFLTLGNSDDARIGQSVIAIGNALGEFRNTVSVGIISGLGRTISAAGGGMVQVMEDVIQTDAAINQGNSGGPLLNRFGEVIGINSATVVGAQNISFAVPINNVKRSIEQVIADGKIVYPFLGVRYDPQTYIVESVVADSSAQEAGILRGDVILGIAGVEIGPNRSLASVIRQYRPGDRVVVKIKRGEDILSLPVILGEFEG